MSYRVICDICGKRCEVGDLNEAQVFYATMRGTGNGNHRRIDLCVECSTQLRKLIEKKRIESQQKD